MLNANKTFKSKTNATKSKILMKCNQNNKIKENAASSLKSYNCCKIYEINEKTINLIKYMQM